jgi:hypothetical protein
MSTLNVVLFGLWLGWVAVAFSLWRSYHRLLSVLKSENNPAWMRIQVKQGSSDILEPLKWYVRFRAYVFASASDRSNAAGYRTLLNSAARQVRIFEIGAAALIVLIAIGAINAMAQAARN